MTLSPREGEGGRRRDPAMTRHFKIGVAKDGQCYYEYFHMVLEIIITLLRVPKTISQQSFTSDSHKALIRPIPPQAISDIHKSIMYISSQEEQ